MRPISKDSGHISQFWLTSTPAADARSYQPAILIECKLTFRSLRASYHHSEERSYTAWYPESDLPVDWDRPATQLPEAARFASVAPVELPYKQGNYHFTPERISEMQEELFNRLLRKEKLSLLYNPIFKIYSTPGEQREQFLSRVSETALMEMEPELRELMRRFELKLEQVRESEERKGRKEPLPEPDLLKLIEKRSELLTSKSRLTSMFLNSAKTTLKSNRANDVALLSPDSINRELHETLYRIEQEACDAVNSLCEAFLERSSQCDTFEIGLQHQNIQVLRRAILWLAVN